MKPSLDKPYRAGKFLISERRKNLGRFLQLKMGRRLLLEVKIPPNIAFRDCEAFPTIKRQADEYHQQGWEPKPRTKSKRVVLTTGDLFEDKTPKKLSEIAELEDLF